MKIAILEDDLELRRHLKLGLTKQGWSVLELQNIEELKTLMTLNEEVDLIIMDRLIGKSDAALQIEKVKAARPQVRILILSSINLPEERAKWLMAGADEYMGKPVFTDELVARIHHLAKRKNEEPSVFITIGDLLIDKFKHQITCQQNRLDVTAKEYGVLLLLAERPGRVFNQIQILEHLWDINSEVATNVVESTINHLRRKLESAGSSVEIKSKRNLGYWIEA